MSDYFELSGKRVWVAGHNGMVGGALVRRLEQECCEVITASRSELDLTDQTATNKWMSKNSLDAVFVAAAKVGGILANSLRPAEFIYENIMIEANLINAAKNLGVRKLLFLGSSCIYPKFSPQPIVEEALLTGVLEPTNEAYAVAKIAGIKLCQSYRSQYGVDFNSAMPTNLYGPGDNFDPETSHVLPALIRKFYEAKLNKERHVIVWGSGAPRREFLHVDDCADALVHLMKNYSSAEHINVGYGVDISIRELSELIAEVVGFDGDIKQDTSKPDGTPSKLMSAEKLREMSWSPSISLRDGISELYKWYIQRC